MLPCQQVVEYTVIFISNAECNTVIALESLTKRIIFIKDDDIDTMLTKSEYKQEVLDFIFAIFCLEI